MPTISMTVRGSDQLRRNLQRLAGNERRQAQRNGLEAGARTYEAIVKNSLRGPSPSSPGDPPGLDTGFLINSVQVDSVTATEAVIAPHTEYAEPLEFGTSRMAARPFMRPALDQHETEIIDAVERTVAAFVESVRA